MRGDGDTPLHGIDLAALRRPPAGRAQWRSFEQIAGSEAFAEQVREQFPGVAPVIDDPTSRRAFLRVMGASLILAGVPGCDVPPPEAIVPWVEQPEGATPGLPRHYASAVPFMGYAQPVVAECHAGRPTRLDGNPRHPAGGRALDPFTQAAVLQLYDPDRSRQVLIDGTRTSSSARAWQHLDAQIEALGARGGEGLRLLTGNISSPTLLAQFDAAMRRFPQLRHHVFEPIGAERAQHAARLAFGRALELRWRLERADLLVDLEADLLGPGPAQLVHARAWSERRKAGHRSGRPARLLVAESTPSLTGAKADERVRAASGAIPALVAALAHALGIGAPSPPLASRQQRFVQRAAAELGRAGAAGVLAIGAHQPARTQALVLAINDRLGTIGTTLELIEPVVAQAEGIDALIADLEAGRVDTLIMLDTNPVFAAPEPARFAAALARAPHRVHMGLYADETALAANWHLPLAHPLESWSDGRALDGTAVVIQPTLRPLHGALSAHRLLDVLAGRPRIAPRESVRETWRARLADDGAWRAALEAGFVAGSAAPPLRVQARMPEQAAEIHATADGLEAVFRAHPCTWDARFANLGWLQELPAPLTRLTWDNAALLSPDLAGRVGVSDGDGVRIRAGAAEIELPVMVLPGQARDTVTLHLGHGRRRAGRVGDGAGFDVHPLRTLHDPWRRSGISVHPSGRTHRLADTQMHHTMAGHDLVREVGAAVAAAAPRAELPGAHHATLHHHQPAGPAAWAMSIDLDLCIGCNACVTACVAENNIPVVGKEQVRRGREMHWIRVDRYFEGDADDPVIHFQPVPCMHCEHAPCEVGCPVNATVHGPEGLNQMIYNRCIGTRTCSSYCPYKVRRFNFFDYTAPASEEMKAIANPHVTVRARGVMEKCTYCVQRISAARRRARLEERDLRDGEVRTACQDACPAQAIVFGDQNRTGSAIERAKRDPRHYVLLEETNVRPRTAYRARVRGE